MSSAPRRVSPEAPARRGWCPSLARPMPTGDGLLARVHPALGLLTVAQVRAVAEAARRFGNGHVDVTARGNLQIRGVTEATAPALATHLAAAGLGDVRADGGPQRLTLTSPLAGLRSDEGIDVPALAAAIERAGLAIPGLPAKTLVAIAGAGVEAAEADVSLRPIPGGRIAIALAEGEGGATDPVTVPKADAASAVASILRAFAASGARRVRDLSDGARVGLLTGIVPDGSVARLSSWRHDTASLADRSNSHPDPEAADAASQRPADQAHPLSRPHPEVPRQRPRRRAPGIAAASGGLLRGCSAAPQDEVAGGKPIGRPDSQDEMAAGTSRAEPSAGERPGASTALSAGAIPLGGGRVALAVEAPFGRCDAGTLDRLAGIAALCDSGEPIRTSPNRGFVLVCETSGKAVDALRRLAAAGFVTEPGDPRRAIAACPGAPACASGSTATIRDAGRLAQAFAPLAAAGLSAHVSGCAKGCARPAPADLTLVGADGRYGVVLRGGPGALPAIQLTFEAALERVRSAASTLSLDDAFRTTS